MNNETIQFLREHPVFRKLSEPYLAEIAQHLSVIRLAPGEELFQEGQSADTFYIVMEGTVDLVAHKDRDDEQWIQMADVGEVIGWSWLVPPYRWMFSARSRDGAMLMRFNAVAIREMCDRDPVFGYGTMKQVCALMMERLHTVRSQMGARISALQKGGE